MDTEQTALLASYQILRIKEIEAQLELGPQWTISRVQNLLKTAPDHPNARIEFIAHQFIGTPFIFESNLPIPPKGRIRVRLESFDCITFIYTILALCHSD